MGAGRGAFSFPSVRIGSPIFSISALSCASLQPLTPITRKPVAETALCIADQFTGSSSALTLSTTGHVLKMRGLSDFVFQRLMDNLRFCLMQMNHTDKVKLLPLSSIGVFDIPALLN